MESRAIERACFECLDYAMPCTHNFNSIIMYMLCSALDSSWNGPSVAVIESVQVFHIHTGHLTINNFHVLLPTDRPMWKRQRPVASPTKPDEA